MAFEITTVTSENLERVGFFCFMSKRKTVGFANKLGWMKERLREGLKIHMTTQGGRGFIEYIPGEYAWRAVHAKGYMFIHCLWNVGKSRGNGLSQALLRMCEDEAIAQGMQGVAMVTSEGNWLIHKQFLLGQGYQWVDQAPPSFSLMVKKFRTAPDPTLCGDWERKQRAFGKGLTLVRTHQCPYLETVASTTRGAAEELGVPFQDVVLRSADEVRGMAPCAYGVNAILYQGKFITNTWIPKADLVSKIKDIRSE